jgi:ATP adenylyltransferase
MEKIYTPWRHNYVSKHDKKESDKKLKNDCVFCDQFAQHDDEKYLIIKRFAHTAVIMNYYPYNAGHLMVIPYEHKAYLSELDAVVRSEMMEGANLSMQIIQEVLQCEGFNVGINFGPAGGGGIQDHLHLHVLPRWMGDTNFLATLADTKLVCSSFQDVYKQLKVKFDELTA